MKNHAAALIASLVAFGMFSGACSPTNSTPGAGGGGGPGVAGSGGALSTAGAPGSAGSVSAAAGASAASCSNVTACGGTVVGTWTVASSCLGVSGNLDVSNFGLDPACTATATGSLTVSGTWSAKADGTYVDNTTTTGTEQIEMAPVCLHISGTTTTCARISGGFEGLGFKSVTCTDNANHGCSCTGTVQQNGGIGIVSPGAQTSGNYATAANVLTADATAPYSYCVAASKMTWTPKTTTPLSTGTIVFDNGSGGGSAGASGGTGAGGTSSAAGAGGTSSTAGAGGTHAAAGAAGMGAVAGAGGGGTGTRGDGPCDIYAAANTKCAAAYSMIRALSKTYTGFLYQVRSGSSAQNTGTGGMTKDIGITSDGFADAAAQDAFCTGSICTVSILYDQSGNKNNLKVAPKGLSAGGNFAAMDDFESSATKGAVTVGGHKAYSLFMNAREGYRLTAKGAGMPVGNTDQGIYMLADGTHYGTACCWDFGNVTTDPTQYHTMNTLFLGTGYWGTGAGDGPWFLGDFEAGVWAGGSGDSKTNNPSNPSMKVRYALGMLKTSSGKYAIRVANLQSAADLTTAYDGASPKAWDNQGGILLGIGADNSNNSYGTFYEGAITAGRPSNDTDLAVMKNVQGAGYGK